MSSPRKRTPKTHVSKAVPLSANKSRSAGEKNKKMMVKLRRIQDYQMLRRITMPRPSLGEFLCPVKSMSIA